MSFQGHTLRAGEEGTGLLASGASYRMVVGVATETVVGVEGCSSSEREPGMKLNAVMLIEEVE